MANTTPEKDDITTEKTIKTTENVENFTEKKFKGHISWRKPPSQKNWIEENWIYLVIIICIFLAVMAIWFCYNHCCLCN